jgi:acylphosphatase
MHDEVVRRRVHLTGRVQGVWFRDSTRAVAADHGVAGWVRNRSDGSVEAVFEGPERAVTKVVDWCRAGPPRARVESARVQEEPPEGLSGFEIR